ncbi:hypothetical protein HYQ46_011421 [Verticillium longisporum]|nr:hypothetical protein HYQ46_011421 [Verticillium longisporum]
MWHIPDEAELADEWRHDVSAVLREGALEDVESHGARVDDGKARLVVVRLLDHVWQHLPLLIHRSRGAQPNW